MQAFGGPKYLPQALTRQYDVQRQLGGQEGRETYYAIRREDSRECVIRLHRESPKTPRERRCLEESYIALRRLKHPDLPRILQVGIPRSGGYFLVSEFARGASLRSLAREITPRFIVEVLARLLPALHLANLCGVVHQRISPDKIIIDERNGEKAVRLVDLGLSPRDDGRRTHPTQYAAPEIQRDGKFDARADLYSLSVSIFEMLQGHHPFQEEPHPFLRGDLRLRNVPPPFMYTEHELPVLEELLLAMGSDDPDQRPKNALELGRELTRTGILVGPAPTLDTTHLILSTEWKAQRTEIAGRQRQLPQGMEIPETEKDDSPGGIREQLSLLMEARQQITLISIGTKERLASKTRRRNEDKEVTNKTTGIAPDNKQGRSRNKETRKRRKHKEAKHDLCQWLVTFSSGPVSNRRCLLLAEYLLWKCEDSQARISGMVSKFVKWKSGLPRLDWADIGSAIAADLTSRTRKGGSNRDSSFPPEGIPARAYHLAKHCFPREAGVMLANASEHVKKENRFAKATMMWRAGRLLRSSGLIVMPTNLMHAAAHEIAHFRPGLEESMTQQAESTAILFHGRGSGGNSRWEAQFTPQAIDHEVGGTPVAGTGFAKRRMKLESTRDGVVGEEDPSSSSLRHKKDTFHRECSVRMTALRMRATRKTVHRVRQIIRRGRLEKARLLLENMLRKPGFGVFSKLALSARSLQAYVLLRMNRYREAFAESASISSDAIQAGDLLQASMNLHNMGVAALESDRTAQARHWFATSCDFYEKHENLILVERQIKDSCIAEYAAGNFLECARTALQGMRLTRNYSGLRDVACTQLNLAVSYSALGKVRRAVRWASRAIERAEQERSLEVEKSARSFLFTLLPYCEDALEASRAQVHSDRKRFPLEEVDALTLGATAGVMSRDLGHGEHLQWSEGFMRAERIMAELVRLSRLGSLTEVETCALLRTGMDESIAWFMAGMAMSTVVLWKSFKDDVALFDKCEQFAGDAIKGGNIWASLRMINLMACRAFAEGWVDRSRRLLQYSGRLKKRYRIRLAGSGSETRLGEFCLEGLRVKCENSASALAGILRLSDSGECPPSQETSQSHFNNELPFSCGPVLRIRLLELLSSTWGATYVRIRWRDSGTCLLAVVRKDTGEVLLTTSEGSEVSSGMEVPTNFVMDSVGRDGWIAVASPRQLDIVVTCGGRGLGRLGIVSRVMLRQAMVSVCECANVVASAKEQGAGPIRPGNPARVGRTRPQAHEVGVGRGRRIVWRSSAMSATIELVRKLASGGVPVLLTGESGTGKELLAMFCHAVGTTSRGALVTVDCPGLSSSLVPSLLFGHERGAFTGATRSRSGFIAEADNGTLFLDEIADLGLDVQAQLLRVLSSREYRSLGSSRTRRSTFTLVSATNVDIDEAVSEGRFRFDLYQRLGIKVRVPALRERLEDVEVLWEYSLKRRSVSDVRYEEDVIDLLREQEWPGNVRELENVSEAALCLMDGDIVTRECVETVLMDLRGDAQKAATFLLPPCSLERKALGLQLIRKYGSLTRRGYAKGLGVSSRTALRDLSELVKAGHAERVGSGRGVSYRSASVR